MRCVRRVGSNADLGAPAAWSRTVDMGLAASSLLGLRLAGVIQWHAVGALHFTARRGFNNERRQHSNLLSLQGMAASRDETRLWQWKWQQPFSPWQASWQQLLGNTPRLLRDSSIASSSPMASVAAGFASKRLGSMRLRGMRKMVSVDASCMQEGLFHSKFSKVQGHHVYKPSAAGNKPNIISIKSHFLLRQKIIRS